MWNWKKSPRWGKTDQRLAPTVEEEEWDRWQLPKRIWMWKGSCALALVFVFPPHLFFSTFHFLFHFLFQKKKENQEKKRRKGWGKVWISFFNWKSLPIPLAVTKGLSASDSKVTATPLALGWEVYFQDRLAMIFPSNVFSFPSAVINRLCRRKKTLEGKKICSPGSCTSHPPLIRGFHSWLAVGAQQKEKKVKVEHIPTATKKISDQRKVDGSAEGLRHMKTKKENPANESLRLFYLSLAVVFGS